MERITVKSTDLFEISDAINQIRVNCQDYICQSINQSSVAFNEDKQRFEFRFLDEMSSTRELFLTDYSMSQLCGRLGVPFQYVEKCVRRKESWALELLLENLNTWIANADPTELLIRGYGDSVRGILSQNYTVFDSSEVIEGVNRGLGNYSDDYSVEGYTVTPERVHVRIVKKTPIKGIDEDLYSGLIIDCSDVGSGAITIGAFVFKQICQNGLIVRKLRGMRFRQIHRGSFKDIQNAVISCIAALDPYEKLIGKKIKQAQSIDLKDSICVGEEDIENTGVFQYVRAISGLSKKRTRDVFKIASTVYDPTAWGMINAMTQVAQEYSLEKRLLIEEAAGQYLMHL